MPSPRPWPDQSQSDQFAVGAVAAVAVGSATVRSAAAGWAAADDGCPVRPASVRPVLVCPVPPLSALRRPGPSPVQGGATAVDSVWRCFGPQRRFGRLGRPPRSFRESDSTAGDGWGLEPLLRAGFRLPGWPWATAWWARPSVVVVSRAESDRGRRLGAPEPSLTAGFHPPGQPWSTARPARPSVVVRLRVAAPGSRFSAPETTVSDGRRSRHATRLKSIMDMTLRCNKTAELH